LDYQFQWESDAQVRIFRRRSAQRVLVQTLGGYFPVAAKLPDGRIGIISRDGDFHVGMRGRLCFVTSRDGGISWSHSRIVAGAGPDDRNAGFGVLPDGSLLLAFMRQDGYDGGTYVGRAGRPFDPSNPHPRHYLQRSTDGGETWSDPEHFVLPTPGSWSFYGKIVSLADGTVLLSTYGSPWLGDRLSDHMISGVLRSPDGGRTWEPLCVIGGEPPPEATARPAAGEPGKCGFNETALLPLPSGRILAAARLEHRDRARIGPNLYLGHSDDAGRTWSPLRRLTNGDEHPANLLLLQDGRILLTYGSRNPPFGVHGMISRDGGETWDRDNVVQLVTEATNRDCGYPSAVQLDDGRIFIAYYAYSSYGPWPMRPGRRENGVHCGGVLLDPADLP